MRKYLLIYVFFFFKFMVFIDKKIQNCIELIRIFFFKIKSLTLSHIPSLFSLAGFIENVAKIL